MIARCQGRPPHPKRVAEEVGSGIFIKVYDVVFTTTIGSTSVAGPRRRRRMRTRYHQGVEGEDARRWPRTRSEAYEKCKN